jgi:eukaryotic-like serine/threonine-protein kinase
VRPVLRACLARRPEDRVASAEALRRMLSPLRRARPEGGPSELARWVREGRGQGHTGGSSSGTVLEET